MVSSGITNRELKKRLGNIGQKEWLKLAKDNELLVLSGKSGSHYINIRDPKNSDPKDPRGLITTLIPKLFKQANEEIFKRFLKYGLSENDIWKGLGMM